MKKILRYSAPVLGLLLAASVRAGFEKNSLIPELVGNPFHSPTKSTTAKNLSPRKGGKRKRFDTTSTRKNLRTAAAYVCLQGIVTEQKTNNEI